MAKKGSSLKIMVDHLDDLRAAIKEMITHEILVGFPEDSTEREEGTEEDAGITNAALGYIHDNGSPEVNIPARPFMIPGITNAKERIARGMFMVAKNTLKGTGALGVQQGFHAVGLVASSAIKRKINEGIPPPLSEYTLRERANRGGKSKGRKGALWELAWRDAGAPAGVELAKPLIDTGQLRNAVTYVIRERSKRKR